MYEQHSDMYSVGKSTTEYNPVDHVNRMFSGSHRRILGTPRIAKQQDISYEICDDTVYNIVSDDAICDSVYSESDENDLVHSSEVAVIQESQRLNF